MCERCESGVVSGVFRQGVSFCPKSLSWFARNGKEAVKLALEKRWPQNVKKKEVPPSKSLVQICHVPGKMFFKFVFFEVGAW